MMEREQDTDLATAFGLPEKRLSEISAALLAYISFYKKKDSRGVGESELIRVSKERFTGDDREAAMFLISRFSGKHEANDKSGPIHMAFVMQSAYRFETEKELAAKIYERLEAD